MCSFNKGNIDCFNKGNIDCFNKGNIDCFNKGNTEGTNSWKILCLMFVHVCFVSCLQSD